MHTQWSIERLGRSVATLTYLLLALFHAFEENENWEAKFLLVQLNISMVRLVLGRLDWKNMNMSRLCFHIHYGELEEQGTFVISCTLGLFFGQTRKGDCRHDELCYLV